MKIEKIAAQNIKGRSFAHALSPLNVVVGDNFSGKTTILSAIRLALLGYDPAIGKRAPDTFLLATGDSMSVDAVLTGGQTVHRLWKKKGNSVSCAAPEFAVDVPGLLIDISLWFKMTAQERRDYVLLNYGSGMIGKPDDQILSDIAGALADASVSVEKIENARDWWDFWTSERDERKTEWTAWLEGLIADQKASLANATARIKEYDALISQIASERIANPAGLPPDREAEALALKGKIELLQKESGGGEAKRQMLNKELGRLLAFTVDDVNNMVVELDAMNKEHARLSGMASPYAEAAEARTAVASIDNRSRELVRQAEQFKKQIGEAKKFQCCPTCGNSDVAAVREKMVTALEKQAGPVSAELMGLVLKKAEADERLEKAVAAVNSYNQAQAELRDLNAKMAVLNPQITTARAAIERRKEIERELSGIVIVDELPKLEAALEEIKASEKRRLLMLERRAQEATAVQGRDEALVETVVCKAVLKVLTLVQEKAVVSVFDPLLAAVRNFTDGLLPFELSHKDGDLGYVGPRKQWVSHETFSGAEKAITYAGLAVALANKSPVKIVMLDELIVSRPNKVRVADKMRQLVDAGHIDQFLICDTEADAWPEWVNKVNAAG